MGSNVILLFLSLVDTTPVVPIEFINMTSCRAAGELLMQDYDVKNADGTFLQHGSVYHCVNK